MILNNKLVEKESVIIFTKSIFLFQQKLQTHKFFLDGGKFSHNRNSKYLRANNFFIYYTGFIVFPSLTKMMPKSRRNFSD